MTRVVMKQSGCGSYRRHTQEAKAVSRAAKTAGGITDERALEA